MNYFKSSLWLLLLLLCRPDVSADSFAPYPSPNPWADDYSSVSSMDQYRSWGTYNVHDPSCAYIDGYYYMYSTDAIYFNRRHRSKKYNVPTGFIQVRRSRDLVNWEFCGWAFSEIPAEARVWVQSKNDGRGASNIWAPYIVNCGDKLRLYYSVSAFGKPTSYIGLAESTSPVGPWIQKGCVVRTDETTAVNAIDPTVITDRDGRWWMHYGSYFGGIYCIELDADTGLPLEPGTIGHLVARRANYKTDNLEAPEIIYNGHTDTYYLFGSYDPLMTTYNVRVARSESAAGPFIDYHGREMRDTTDNFPILTAPYRFSEHPGWAGTGHCGVFETPDGRFFMVHQGRLSPDNEMMDLHVRQLFFTAGGWPVVSPQRYAGSENRTFLSADIAGEWEVVRVQEPRAKRGLEAGQVLWGEGHLFDGECNTSVRCSVNRDGTVKIDSMQGQWRFDEAGQLLSLEIGGEEITDLIVHAGHDWELHAETILFTGLDSRGRSVWGKRVK